MLGGNGYLGSKVAERLVEECHSLVCTKRRSSNLSRMKKLDSEIRWIPASVDAVETAVNYSKFDWIINMVCNYGRGNVLYDNVINANIEFPLKVLNVAAENEIPNYLTIGTGLPDGLNMYSFSKKMFSEFGRFYADKNEINFYDLRPEMFYGADEPADRFLPSVIHGMLAGNEINTTMGTQHRDIIAVQDIVQAVMMVIKNGQRGYHEIPVGTGIAPTISEIIDYIWDETGRKSKVNKGAVPMRNDEPDCIADTAFLKSIGVWNPVYWKYGIKQMIKEIGFKSKSGGI